MTNSAPTPTPHFWRPDGLAGVEILHEHAATRLHTLYFHAYTISAAVNVATDVQYQHRKYTITSGSVHLGEPGEVYTALRQYHPCSVHVVHLDPDIMKDAAYELGFSSQPHFQLPITWDSDAYTALLAFHHALSRDGSALEQQTRLTEIMRLLLTRYTEHTLAKPMLHVGKAALYRAREYLHAHGNANVTLDELAQVAHHSKSYFVDSFRREFGIPPHAYQIYLRIARARLLLAGGDAISDVATRVGFADQAHLTRYFKRILGVTPATYVRNRKIVQDSDSHAV